MTLTDLKLRRAERFIYEYDFGDDWIQDQAPMVFNSMGLMDRLR